MRFTLLGTGTSHGIPMIGCDCPVCTSDDPHDRRTRVSIHVEYDDGFCILVDAAPELRLQCVANNIRRVDAVLMTHHHADHITGLDDIRRFNWLQKKTMPIHGMPETLDRLRQMFWYAFITDPDYPSSKPAIELIPIDGELDFDGRRIIPVPLMHGPMPVLGFRFGNFAYCTDCSFISDESMALLQDLDVLILDALRRRPHPTHFNLEQALDWAARIGAKQTFFTHIAHELKHAETNAALPPHTQLAHDNQIIEL